MTLNHDVTLDRTVYVTSTIPGTPNIVGAHYDTSVGQIWHETGDTPTSGGVTLDIYNGQSLEFTAHATLPTPEECATTTTAPTTTTEPTTSTSLPTLTSSSTTVAPASSTTRATVVPTSNIGTAVHLAAPVGGPPAPPSQLPFTGSNTPMLTFGACLLIAVGIFAKRAFHGLRSKYEDVQ